MGGLISVNGDNGSLAGGCDNDNPRVFGSNSKKIPYFSEIVQDQFLGVLHNLEIKTDGAIAGIIAPDGTSYIFATDYKDWLRILGLSDSKFLIVYRSIEEKSIFIVGEIVCGSLVYGAKKEFANYDGAKR
jgi:hypothetical protein